MKKKSLIIGLTCVCIGVCIGATLILNISTKASQQQYESTSEGYLDSQKVMDLCVEKHISYELVSVLYSKLDLEPEIIVSQLEGLFEEYDGDLYTVICGMNPDWTTEDAIQIEQEYSQLDFGIDYSK